LQATVSFITAEANVRATKRNVEFATRELANFDFLCSSIAIDVGSYVRLQETFESLLQASAELVELAKSQTHGRPPAAVIAIASLSTFNADPSGSRRIVERLRKELDGVSLDKKSVELKEDLQGATEIRDRAVISLRMATLDMREDRNGHHSRMWPLFDEDIFIRNAPKLQRAIGELVLRLETKTPELGFTVNYILNPESRALARTFVQNIAPLAIHEKIAATPDAALVCRTSDPFVRCLFKEAIVVWSFLAPTEVPEV